MTQTHLAETLDLAATRAAYDAACKQILAHRQILARVLTGTLGEYAGLDAAAVEQLIRADPQVSSAPVHGQEVVAGPSEDARPDEGSVMYDVLFEAGLPESARSAAIMVNIEVQRSSKSWRWLLARSIYYCSRMIAAQRGRVFKGSDYDRMNKVVSIWICPHAIAKAGTVTSFSLSCEPKVGMWFARKEDFDLLETIVVRLGDPGESTGVSRMLGILLSEKIHTEEKKRLLASEYNIAMTEELEDEVESMSGMGEALWQEALQEGYAQGLEQGLEQARDTLAARMRDLGLDEQTVQAVLNGTDAEAGTQEQ